MFLRNLRRAIFIVVLGCLHGFDLVGEVATGATGKVVDKTEYAPIRNAYVLVHRNGGTDKAVRTDASGRYVIDLLPSTYDLFISADGFAPVCHKIQIPQSGMIVFDVVLQRSKVGLQETSPVSKAAPGTPQGVVGDIPGGLPPNRKTAKGGIVSSEPQSAGVPGSTRVRVSQEVMRYFLITKVDPSYPPEAERQHVDGIVLLRIDIDKTGSVSRAYPVSGHPLLMPAAIDAVKQWKYKPYLVNQKPVEVETTVLIKFVISGGNAYPVIAITTPHTSNWR